MPTSLYAVSLSFLLVRVAVGIKDTLKRRSEGTRGISVLNLGQNVPAAVVTVHSCRVFSRIIDADQLVQSIIGVSRGDRTTRGGEDISYVVIDMSLFKSILKIQ